MRRKKIITSLMLVCCISPLSAQYATPEEAIQVYDFAGAHDMLEEKIAKLSKRRKPTEDIAPLEALLEVAEKREGVLQATQKVTFIDSLVVPKSELLSTISFSKDMGQVLPYSEYFGQEAPADYTVFKAQLGNQIIFSHPAGNTLRLFSSNLIGKKWTDAEPLHGLDETDSLQNYPFMLADGTTLYFAADNKEGLGGYDIYMTRYDADDNTFLEPENLGMPFNSPANDYMYVIDEYNQLGWFATDRNQAEGYVCIYTFIPNDKRQIYNEDEIGYDNLRGFARITDIRRTWTDQGSVQEALERLQTVRNATVSSSSTQEFSFVLTGKKVCTKMSDFTNKEARDKVKIWQENIKLQQKINNELAQLRSTYATADATKKGELAPQIQQLEAQGIALYADIHQMEKDIRKLELAK